MQCISRRWVKCSTLGSFSFTKIKDIFIDSQFQPRAMSDRPKVVPEGSINFAMISHFVEITEDMAFAGEYSIRTLLRALNTLFR